MEFIYFGNDWFAENRTSSHHISKRIGAKFPLLYVEVPGLRTPKANARDLGKVWQKLRAALQPPQQVGPHLWRMTLPQIPMRKYAAIRALNGAFSRYFLRKAIRKLGFRDYVAWFHLPHPGFLAKQLGEKLTVYYCVDEYSKYPNVDAKAVKQLDDDLTRASDIVFTCNQPLLDDRVALNPNISVSPHGVDAEVFALASAPETQIPEAAKKLQRPVIGSWGLIDERVDMAIVEHIARSRPNWSILLIGRIAVDVSALKSLPNVTFAGVRPYAELPQWAKAIDVCILPYIQTELIIQSSPLKLREYLASGKPIVAVPLPETAMLGKAIQAAVDGPSFVRAIEEALAADTPELAAIRQRAIEGNTWDAVANNALARVEAELQRKTAKA
jgi:glycosyltransferase involved in cell wall biosynthesis